MRTIRQTRIEWYFDFISPFAYLQHHYLENHYPVEAIIYKPILFAGLLKHWSHRGPAEIPRKRTMTYQYCHWLAARQNISFRTPEAHPFNPLPALRLAISQNCSHIIIKGIFDTIWGKGIDPSQEENWEQMVRDLNIENGSEAITQPWVKEALKENTGKAIDQGVFGVPTIIVGNKLFWGHDMTEMALNFIADPALFETPDYKRLEDLPIAQARK